MADESQQKFREIHAGCGGIFDSDPESGVWSCQRCRMPSYACTIDALVVPAPPPSKDFMARSIKRRQQAWINEWRQLQNDVDHWNRTHPDEEPIVIEPIIAAEIVEGLPR